MAAFAAEVRLKLEPARTRLRIWSRFEDGLHLLVSARMQVFAAECAGARSVLPGYWNQKEGLCYG